MSKNVYLLFFSSNKWLKSRIALTISNKFSVPIVFKTHTNFVTDKIYVVIDLKKMYIICRKLSFHITHAEK